MSPRAQILTPDQPDRRQAPTPSWKTGVAEGTAAAVRQDDVGPRARFDAAPSNLVRQSVYETVYLLFRLSIFFAIAINSKGWGSITSLSIWQSASSLSQGLLVQKL